MNHWLKQSIETILPLSMADTFTEAQEEWNFVGKVRDHGEAVETCQLCTHDGLRYHFGIVNVYNNNGLWVGSECINKFTGIRVYDEDGTLLEGENRMKQLKERVEHDRFTRMVEELDTLWRVLVTVPKPKPGQQVKIIPKPSPRVIASIRKSIHAAYHTEHKGFTPYEVVGLFRNMRRLGIEYTPGLYKVNLRTEHARDELNAIRDMEKCLNLEQRKRSDFAFELVEDEGHES